MLMIFLSIFNLHHFFIQRIEKRWRKEWRRVRVLREKKSQKLALITVWFMRWKGEKCKREIWEKERGKMWKRERESEEKIHWLETEYKQSVFQLLLFPILVHLFCMALKNLAWMNIEYEYFSFKEKYIVYMCGLIHIQFISKYIEKYSWNDRIDTKEWKRIEFSLKYHATKCRIFTSIDYMNKCSNSTNPSSLTDHKINQLKFIN